VYITSYIYNILCYILFSIFPVYQPPKSICLFLYTFVDRNLPGIWHENAPHDAFDTGCPYTLGYTYSIFQTPFLVPCFSPHLARYAPVDCSICRKIQSFRKHLSERLDEKFPECFRRADKGDLYCVIESVHRTAQQVVKHHTAKNPDKYRPTYLPAAHNHNRQECTDGHNHGHNRPQSCCRRLKEARSTAVDGSGTTIPAFCSPSRVINKPIHEGMAALTGSGRESNIFFRRPVTVRRIKTIPSSRIRTSALA